MSDYPICGDPQCLECRKRTWRLIRQRTRPHLADGHKETVKRYREPHNEPYPWAKKAS